MDYYKQLVEKLDKLDIAYNPDSIKKAFEFAQKAYKGEKRLSGQDYIIHPLNVALICAELQLDQDSIIVALLHKINTFKPELEAELEFEFGEGVKKLYNDISALSSINKSIVNLQFADSLRKMILASSKDIRVIFIKLADKLDNMRTLQFLEEKKRKEIARITLEIYAPIANRFGLGKIKSELEDLSLKHLNPEAFEKIKNFLPQKKKEREEIINNTLTHIQDILGKENIKATVLGRPKNIYSIYKKTAQQKELQDIFDLLAFRIVTKNIKDCYDALRIIHTNFKPIPNRLKDYIANPKENNYQSLHTTVYDKNNNVFEIQIRTEEMHNIAEAGIAAHFVYKGFDKQEKFDKKISWLKEIIDKKEDESNKELVDLVKLEFFSDKIYCITPAGKVINLPKGATAIDFAYAIHSQVGNSAIGVRINGKFFPLRTEIRNGQLIEVITQKGHHPSRSWLKFAKSQKARAKIRKALSELSTLPTPKYIKKDLNVEESKNTSLVQIKGLKHFTLRFARCCNPLPGDDIIAVNPRGNTVNIHKKKCYKLLTSSVRKDNILQAQWLEDQSGVIELKIVADDRKGLMIDLLNTISTTGAKINSANAKLIESDRAEFSFQIEIESLEHMNLVMERISNVRSVNNFYITKC